MTDSQPIGVAVVGCGTISGDYLGNLTSFPDAQVLFCADLEVDRAKEQADAFGVSAAGTPDEALRYPGVELVVNLTVPAAHAEVAEAAVAAGKHVWNEKPLAHSVGAGQELLEQACRALALMQDPGPESWHPSPEFLYEAGAGPCSMSALIIWPPLRCCSVRQVGWRPSAGVAI
jgi:Oxidoreductase family, NAD-binding Rossmann fold